MNKRKVIFWLEESNLFGFDPEQTEEEAKQIEGLTKKFPSQNKKEKNGLLPFFFFLLKCTL